MSVLFFHMHLRGFFRHMIVEKGFSVTQGKFSNCYTVYCAWYGCFYYMCPFRKRKLCTCQCWWGN